ncbi:MAG TPA: hypothetical protein VGB93_13030 [Methylovirgula sp.]
MRLNPLRPKFFAALFAAALMTSTGDSSFAGPFSSLAGNWAGNGTLTMSGTRERIRCRAIYFVSSGGESLQQILRCASDNFIIDVHSNVIEIDGRLSGTWQETSSGVSGSLSGIARGGTIRGLISGLGVTASLSLITRSRSQYASIGLSGATTATVVVNFHRI